MRASIQIGLFRARRLLRSHESGEVFAITPNQEKRDCRDDNSHSKTCWRHQDVKGKDVYDDRPEQRQAEWRPATCEQQDAACDLVVSNRSNWDKERKLRADGLKDTCLTGR